MHKKRKRAIDPTRDANYSKWYQEVIKASDLAEHSPVRGCMIIKPWGYALWENIQNILDKRFKETGHQNAYFPLFIPLSYLEKEAQHVEGFAKECAVVTHHRLIKNRDAKLVPDPDALLEDALIVRPTSEMMVGEMFSKWISSYRDLPILLNQWCNVVRWEMRPRLFLRTAEFLWQEGHTAHATEEEALQEALQMLDIYVDFVENTLAIPVIQGEKTASERFPGAIHTYTFEMMMQDGKALQGGTSHFLGQNFSKASDIVFQDQQGMQKYVWTTSWGVTTRLIGGMIMVHSDDDGLVLPPRIAPTQVVIIPLIHKQEDKQTILTYCQTLKETLSSIIYQKRPLSVIVDERDLRSGDKIWSWIKKGVPIRVEVGMREIVDNQVTVAYRNQEHQTKQLLTLETFSHSVVDQLENIQRALFQKATSFREEHIIEARSKKEFYEFFPGKKALLIQDLSLRLTKKILK